MLRAASPSCVVYKALLVPGRSSGVTRGDHPIWRRGRRREPRQGCPDLEACLGTLTSRCLSDGIGVEGKARPRAVLKDVPPGERLKYPPAGAEFLFKLPQCRSYRTMSYFVAI